MKLSKAEFILKNLIKAVPTDEVKQFVREVTERIAVCWSCNGSGITLTGSRPFGSFSVLRLGNGLSIYGTQCKDCNGLGKREQIKCGSCAAMFEANAFVPCNPTLEYYQVFPPLDYCEKCAADFNKKRGLVVPLENRSVMKIIDSWLKGETKNEKAPEDLSPPTETTMPPDAKVEKSKGKKK